MNRKLSVSLGAALLIFAWLLGAGARPIDAQAEPEYIYGCKVLTTSLLRIVTAPNSCTPILESPIQWRVGPVSGTEFPLVCPSCDLRPIGDFFVESDFAHAYLKGANLQGLDFTGASLHNADLRYILWQDADLTGADLTGAVISGSEGMSAATTTGIIWNNTICPDGSNSDNHSNTCEGHLEP